MRDQKWCYGVFSYPFLGHYILTVKQVGLLIPKIPKEVSYVTSVLEKAGFDAYLVGGCVRDLLIDRVPKDWDITTNAKPEEIVNLFERERKIFVSYRKRKLA